MTTNTSAKATGHQHSGSEQVLSERHRGMLALLALRPRGAILRGEEEKRIIRELTYTGLISDVYEMLGGALSARITEAGRAALARHSRTDEGE